MKTSPCFQFKANFLPCGVLQLLSDQWADWPHQLSEAISKAPPFFLGLPVIIDLEKVCSIETIPFLRLKTLLVENNMVPLGVRGGSDALHAAAEASGLPLLPTNSKATLQEKTDKTPSAKEEVLQLTKLVTTPVRSGMQVYAREGDLIVTAPVSVGAELFADGNVHVYSSLRGRVLAGVRGNLQARIFCHTLEAELVSIAGFYLTKDDVERLSLPEGPKQIYLEKEQLRVEML